MGTWDKGEGTKEKDGATTINEERNVNSEKRKANGRPGMGCGVCEVAGYEVWSRGTKEKEQRKRMIPTRTANSERLKA